MPVKLIGIGEGLEDLRPFDPQRFRTGDPRTVGSGPVEDWVIWMIAAGVLAVGEIVSLSFFLGPIAVAAVVAAVAALAGGGPGRPARRVHRGLRGVAAGAAPGGPPPPATPARIRTGTAALSASEAVVLERVDGDGGQIKLAGEVWTARAYDEDEVLEEGARVQVMQIQGATALVSELERTDSEWPHSSF